MKKISVIYLSLALLLSFTTSGYSQNDEEIEVPFAILEQHPTFDGGDIIAFYDWVYTQLQYPQAALEKNIQGNVYLHFTISAEGKVENVTVAYGVHELLNAEAVRVVSNSPDWRPGLQRNKPVKVKYLLPIVFDINGLEKPEITTDENKRIPLTVDGTPLESITYYLKADNFLKHKEDEMLDLMLIYSSIEEMPEFPGAEDTDSNFLKWLQPQIKNVGNASEGMKVKVAVDVKFTITKKGKVKDVEIVSGSGKRALDEEIKRLVSKSPDWIPAKDKGVAKDVKYLFGFTQEIYTAL